MKPYKILVTGACGVTSRSVVRSLNHSAVFGGKCEFIGTDVCNLEYGIYEGLYDKVYRVPYFNDPSYRPMMERIIAETGVEYAIVIPEPEMLSWCENPFNVKFHRIPPKFGRSVLSKKNLYDNLAGLPIVPKYQILSREEIMEHSDRVGLTYPFWVRDFAEGSTSGKGSFKAESVAELQAWATINRGIPAFMLSEFLPGRNLACFTLFSNGRLVKYGVAERIDYVMGKVAVSGITGNTSKGRLLNCPEALDVSLAAINAILAKTGETMNGLVVTDLKCDASGRPVVTEINLRHVAFTSTFASAGLNFSECQMLILSGRADEIAPGQTLEFPDDNIMLRDVDGLPIYRTGYRTLEMGESFGG